MLDRPDLPQCQGACQPHEAALVLLGNIPRKSMAGPPFSYQANLTTVQWGATYPGGRFAYDIPLDRNYSTKREKFHHRIPGRRSGTGDVLAAAAAILYGLTMVTEDKRVTSGDVARWQRWVLVFMRSYC